MVLHRSRKIPYKLKQADGAPTYIYLKQQTLTVQDRETDSTEAATKPKHHEVGSLVDAEGTKPSENLVDRDIKKEGDDTSYNLHKH
jgi:hypothetical protein